MTSFVIMIRSDTAAKYEILRCEAHGNYFTCHSDNEVRCVLVIFFATQVVKSLFDASSSIYILAFDLRLRAVRPERRLGLYSPTSAGQEQP